MIKLTLNKDKVKSLIKPLDALTKFLSNDDGGIILNFNQATKECAINTKKDSAGAMIQIKYKSDFLKDMDIDADEKVGILKIGDFIKNFSLYQDESNVSFKNSRLTISDSDSEISIRTADVDMIKEGPASFKGASWLADVVIDDRFEKINRAMNILSDEDCVFIKGSASDSSMIFTVRSSAVELNKFVLRVAANVTKDFDIAFKKDVLQIAFDMPTTTKKLNIAERFYAMVGETDEYLMTYYVAKMMQKA